MSEKPDILADLKQKRDELRLQLHLGTKEAEAEWQQLTAEWDKFLSRTQFDKSSEEISEAARELGVRMNQAYDPVQERARLAQSQQTLG